MQDTVRSWGGLLVAMVTPFDAQGHLDGPQAARLAERLVAEGVAGLVLAGTTGESATLSHDEKVALLQAVRAALPDTPLIMGVGSPDTAQSVALTQAAAAHGASGVLVISPYYNKPNQAGLLAHFGAVAAAAPQLPVMLYNHPGRTGVTVEPSTLAALAAACPNLCAIKDSSGSLELATAYRRAVPQLALYSGDDPLTLPYLAVGAVGVVSVSAHVAARELSAMLEAWSSGQLAEARTWHERLYPLHKALFLSPSPGPTKAALAALGFDAGPLRLPLTPPTEAERAQVLEAMRQAHGEVPA